MRMYTICLAASFFVLSFCSTPLRAEFSDTQVTLFIEAKDIKSLFSKRPKDLSSFITDLDTILVQLKEKAATPTRLTLIAQQLTRYQKLTAILKRKPFEYFNYKHFVRLLQQHASLQRQYRQLLRERQQKRTQLPSREIAAVQPSSDKKDPQKSIVVLSAKISLIRSRMDDLDRVLLADDRSFFEKHSDKLALGAVATVVLVWLWMNGYLNGLLGIQKSSEGPGPGPEDSTVDTEVLLTSIYIAEAADVPGILRMIEQLPLSEQAHYRSLLADRELVAPSVSPAPLAVELSDAAAALRSEIQRSNWEELRDLGGQVTALTDDTEREALRTILANRREVLRHQPETETGQPKASPKVVIDPGLLSPTKFNWDSYWEEKHGPDGVRGPIVATRTKSPTSGDDGDEDGRPSPGPDDPTPGE